MASQNIFEQNFVVEENVLSLSSFLANIQETSLGGSAFVGVSVEEVKKKNLYWVVMGYSFQITRWPLKGEKITIATYPGQDISFVYPRHYEVHDERGELLIQGSSLWALLDRTTHKATTPAQTGVRPPFIKKEGELPWPRTLHLEGLSFVGKRLVTSEDIDFNGHLNNVRYLDFALATREKDFYEGHLPTALLINFLAETHLGEEMSLYKGEEDHTQTYQGRVNDKNVFSLLITTR
jgi:medium-chain acyl-[acyl-carrier-protein] hydrolase